MKTLQFSKSSLVVISSLLMFGCVTQKPVAVTDGSNSSAPPVGTEPESTGAPYNPTGGYVPPPNSSPNAAANSNYSPNGAYVPSTAAVDVNARQHTVVRGDTVYNISKRYNITQDNLRSWNNLTGDVVSVGQVLLVKNPNGSYTASTSPATQNPTTPPVSTAPPSNTTPPVASSPSSPNPAPSTTSSSATLRTVDNISWMKPTSGQLVTRYSTATKGIEITGPAGTPVVAAADGKVIYSSTLDGYGKLVIVQHNTKYLTAYGNNQNNLVKEGDTVKRGQKIATMGKTDANRTQLHFELRKDGQAIDPLDYIPSY